jgi:plasmid maintenance system antidote protein VapI
MPAQWTGEIVGKMHIKRISNSELAEQAGYHPKYLSAILNGHRTPTDAENRVRAALDELIAERERAKV